MRTSIRAAGGRPGAGFFLLVILSVFGEFSCRHSVGPDPFSVQRIVVRLPDLPPVWAATGDISFRLEWRAAGGSRGDAHAAPGASLEIELDRGESQAILAIPVLRGRELRPAGARYPADLEEGSAGGLGTCRLTLGWRRGWLAALYRTLAAGGHDPESFNLERLDAVLGSAPGDPWILDPSGVARRLVKGSFRESLFSEPLRFAVRLPGPGPWCTESALAPQPVAGEEGRWTVPLPPGISVMAGPDAALAVGVDAGGRASFAWLR